MRKGFSLIETLIAVSIFALVISASMGTWMLFMHKSDRANTQASLDMDIRMVTERFRYDLRKTGRETILFYPPEQQPHQAVGFALTGLDADGRVEIDPAKSKIRWRETVVYHVWNPSSDQMEMRRTVFANRNPEATDNERLNQLAGVVNAGEGGGACLGGETAQTTVLFKNLFTGKLWHSVAEFDAYAPPPGLREKVTFGSVLLGPGSHAVNFTVAGKNDHSSGYALRLDQVAASVSAWPLEAELRETEGANASSYFIGPGLAGGAYGLSAATAGIGDTLSVKVLNDAVEECEFIGSPRCVSFSNTVVRFDEQFQPGGFEEGVNTAKLDGQFDRNNNWEADEQANSSANLDVRLTNSWAFRVPLLSDQVRVTSGEDAGRPRDYGVQKEGFGPVFRLRKDTNNGGILIEDLMCWVDASSNVVNSQLSPNVDNKNQVDLRLYYRSDTPTTWNTIPVGAYVEARPVGPLRYIPMGATLMFGFSVRLSSSSNGELHGRPINRSDSGGRLPGSWLFYGGGRADLLNDNWTGISQVSVTNILPVLESMVVNYADAGEYISHPYDTGNTTGAAKSFEWGEPYIPSGVGAAMKMYARGGDALTEDGFGIADAQAWANVAQAGNGGGFSGNSGRYVQFRAVFTAQHASLFPNDAKTGYGLQGPYRSDTPKLQWARFTWDGEEKFVDVTADLLKSPDGGKFEVNVDGKPLVRGVTMELEIYKDVRTGGAAKERLTSGMTVEIEPRNSGR